MEPLGLYIHIPFCEKKCPYCDFNTYAGLQDSFQALVDALCLEMKRWHQTLSHRVIDTIFLGGGTPTILEPYQLEQIFKAVHDYFQVSKQCEITCEANPGTVDRQKFTHLRSLGINRLSLGVQSFQPDELNFLGRIHDVADVYQAFEAARRAGFENINLDFMFGLPDQLPALWQDTMDQALTLGPEHLSLYSLIVEPKTPLSHWVETGRVAEPDEDNAATLYEMAMEQLPRAGYHQYEVSNWAKDDGSRCGKMPKLACQHNLIYWRNQEYLGIGPGAHSHLRHDDKFANSLCLEEDQPMAESAMSVARRWGNRKPVAGYVKRVERGDPVNEFCEDIDNRVAMAETMMLGLRLIDEGVSLSRFQARHDVDLEQIFAQELQDLQAWNLIAIADDIADSPVVEQRICLTERGLMVGNQVFMHFL